MATEIIEIDLERQAFTWPERAKAIIIRDQQTYTMAGNLLVGIAGLEKQIIDHHTPIKTAAFAAHKTAVAAEKRLLDPLTEAKAILKRGIGTWEQDQERARQEAERKAREESARIEQEMRLQAAIDAQSMGAVDEVVEEILERPMPIMAPIIAPTFNRVQGISTQQRWKAEVFDLKALCAAIISGAVPSNYVEPNMTALNNRARTDKSAMNIPGVRAIPETSVSVRR